VLYNRGNSKFALYKFDQAYGDFSAANSQRAGSDTALAMGNCKVLTGEFGEAMQSYVEGSQAGQGNAVANCGENAGQLALLIRTLHGKKYSWKQDGLILHVEAAIKPRSFPFTGNQGNVGNTGNTPSGMASAPGGKGYGGMPGFMVMVRPPSPEN